MFVSFEFAKMAPGSVKKLRASFFSSRANTLSQTMKKILLFIPAIALCYSCMTKHEQTSTEGENAKEDAASIQEDAKELSKEPADSLAKDLKDEIKAKDGFEGQKSQY